VARKKGRGRRVVLSLTGLAGVALVLNRLGILTTAFFSYLTAGNFSGMVSVLETSLTLNFTGGGLATTIALFIGYFVVALVVKWALKGKTIPLKGSIRAVGA